MPESKDYLVEENGNSDLIKGTNDQDILTGDDSNNRFNGLDGNDIFYAEDGDDRIMSGRGDDTVFVGAGSDRVYGGAGWDIVWFDGDVRDYQIEVRNNRIEVTHRESGDLNRLWGIEQLQFENVQVFLDGRNSAPAADDLRVEIGEDSAAISANLLAEMDAYDFDGDLLSVVAVSGEAGKVGKTVTLPSGALLTVAGDGSYHYDPGQHFEMLKSGETALDTVSIAISDGTDTILREFSVSIFGQEDAPVADDVFYLVDEDSASGIYAFSAHDVDAGDDETLQFQSPDMYRADSQDFFWTTKNTYAVNLLDGRFELFAGDDLQQLSAGETVELSYRYLATDVSGLESNEALAVLRVAGANDAPTLDSDITALLLAGSGVYTLSYLVDDPDSDNSGADLVYRFIDLPQRVDIADNGNGTFTIDTDHGFESLAADQSMQLTFSATDRHGASATFATWQIAGVNDAPLADNDVAQTEEDQSVVIDVLANDGDIDDGDLVSVVSVGNGAHGITEILEDGTLRYTPDANFFGEDGFDYVVSDNWGGTATGRVTVTVNPLPDPPIAEDVLYVTDEDHAGGFYEFSAYDPDLEETAALRYFAEGMYEIPYPLEPNRTATSAVNHADGRFEILAGSNLQRLAAGEEVEFSYRYYAMEPSGAQSNVALATVKVLGVNDAPVKTAAGTTLISADSGWQHLSFGVDDPDNDNSAADLQYEIVNLPDRARYVDGNDGTFDILTDQGFEFVAEGEQFALSISATDRHGAQSLFNHIEIIGKNDEPVAVADAVSTDENQPLIIDVLQNDTDVDGDIVSIHGVGAAEHGTVLLREDGMILYTPDADFVGEDHFHYAIRDPYGDIAQSDVTVTVNRVNEPPVALDDYFTVVSGDMLERSVFGNHGNGRDYDDGDFSLVKLNDVEIDWSQPIVELDSGALVTLSNQTDIPGGFLYDPLDSFDYLAAGESALDTFRYTIEDEDGLRSEATATIKVRSGIPQTIDFEDQMLHLDFETTRGEVQIIDIDEQKSHLSYDFSINDIASGHYVLTIPSRSTLYISNNNEEMKLKGFWAGIVSEFDNIIYTATVNSEFFDFDDGVNLQYITLAAGRTDLITIDTSNLDPGDYLVLDDITYW